MSDSLGEGAKIALQKQTDAFVKLNQQYAAQEQKVKEIASRLHDVQRQKIETAEFKELSKDLDKAKASLDRLYDRRDSYVELGKKVPPKLDLDISDAERKIRLLEGDIKELKLTNKAYVPVDTTKVQQELAAAEQKQMQIYTALQTSADAISQKTSERIAKEDIVREKISAEVAEEERLDQIRVNAVASNDQIIAKVERLKQLEQEIADLKAAERTEGYADYDNRIQEAARLRQDIQEYNNELTKTPEKFEKMRTSAKKAFSAVASGTKKSSGLLSTFASRMKGLALSLLIFNWISKAFNAMISGMKTGFSNFAGYSNSYAQSVQNMKNAMSTLGNQFAAAFAPIVQMVIPWLNSLINAITTAMTYVAQFIAILGGKGTFTKAKQQQDAYNKSLGGTAKAADKAQGALAKFDDLDVLQKQYDAGGGGGAGSGEDFKNMFEEVPVDFKLPGFIDDIINKLKEIKDIFRSGFFEGFGDFEPRIESLKSSIESIKNSLIDIFTDPSVTSSASNYIDSLIRMFGTLAGSIASIGLTIATNLVGGIAKYLEQNSGRIKDYLIDMFNIGSEINGILSGLFESIAYVFEAFSGETAQQLTANLIGIFTDAFMGAQEIVLKLSRDILNIIISPFVENKEDFRTALEGFLEILEEVTGTIKDTIDHTFDKLNDVYDEHFKPFFDSVAEGLSRITESFLKFWNENVQPILDNLASKFDEVMSQHVQPMIDKGIELLGKFSALLKVLWENVLVPLVQWVISNILPVILPIFEGLYAGIMEVVGRISDVISGLIEIFQGVIDFLIGVFTGDWDLAWQGISEIVTGWMDVISGFIDTVMETIKTIFVTALNIISATWTSAFTVIGNFVKTITSAILTTITGFMSSAKTGISTVLENIKATWNNIWTEMKTSVSTIFSEMWASIKNTINSIIGGVESMANGVVKAINKMIDALNSISFDIPDWIPGIGGNSFSLNLKTVPTVSIPRLATGAVIRGGDPFMAILGDQPAGRTNIEAPLDTIKQAVREELSNMNIGSNESVPVTINLNYDGETFARLSISDILSELDRQGYDISVLGAT